MSRHLARLLEAPAAAPAGDARRPLAWVSGASRGVGAAIALALAHSGHDLALSDLADAGATATAAEAAGARVLALRSDPAHLGHQARVLAEVLAWARGAGIACLVNAGSVCPPVHADLLELEAERFDDEVDTHLRGSFFLIQAVARHMARTASPRPRAIVTVCSAHAERVASEHGGHCVSEAGLAMVNQLFAQRLAPLGIGVFEVRPGAGDEGGTKTGTTPDAAVAAVVAELAQGRLSCATGSVIRVEGTLALPLR